MSDFPANPTLPVLGVGVVSDLTSGAAPSSANWVAANQAQYYPIRLRDPYLVSSMYVLFGSITSTKNWDIGLYDRAGTKLFSTGSFAGTTDTFIVKTLTTAMMLSPGTYYMALASSSGTTNGVIRRAATRAGLLAQMGVASQATAFPLPATATFAANNSIIVPVMGIASITSY